MLSTILRTIRTHELVQEGDRVIVAVSGGPDSMALLHALVRLAPRLGLSLEVATVDHGLRPEARAEAALVRSRARAMDLKWHGLRVDVAAAREGRASLQDGARRARLGALEALASSRGARVALAHQADDQAETVLFRVVRGTGLAGLAGIPYRRGPFIRPLLDVWRAEIARYVARHRLAVVDDPSNADPRFARARIRHRLLPALAAENPRARAALVRLAAAARAISPATAGAAGEGASAARLRRAERGGSGGVRAAASHSPVRSSHSPVRAPPVIVSGGGTYLLPGAATALRVRLGDAPMIGSDGAAAAFDAEALAWPLVVRARRPGDRMRPRGGRGSRKVADILIDAKVPRGLRETLPVLTGADGVVLYVPGARPSEDGRPTGATRRFLHVQSRNAAPHFSKTIV